MASLAAVVILANLIIINDVAWILLRAFSGFCFAGAAMIVESWLNEVTDNTRRGTVFAFYTTTNLSFATLGQAAIAVLGVNGFLPFVIGAMAFGLAVLPTAISVSPQPKPLVRARLDLSALIRNSPLSVMAALAVATVAAAMAPAAEHRPPKVPRLHPRHLRRHRARPSHRPARRLPLRRLQRLPLLPGAEQRPAPEDRKPFQAAP